MKDVINMIDMTDVLNIIAVSITLAYWTTIYYIPEITKVASIAWYLVMITLLILYVTVAQ